MPALQKEFVGGSNGFYVANASGGWGPRLNPELGDQYYDNVGEFLGTGFMQKYDISVSGGNELFSAYASANYMDNEGVVPNDYKKRLGFFVKGEFNPSNTMKIMLSANYIDNNARGFGNSMSTVYGWAINRNMADYALPNGLPNWACRYDDWGLLTDAQRLGAGLSPYYSRYMDDSLTESQRIIINSSISWEPIKNLTITGKFAYDKGWSTYQSWTRPRYATDEFVFDDLGVSADGSGSINDWYGRMGTFNFDTSRGQRITAQGLINYTWDINSDWNLNFFLGNNGFLSSAFIHFPKDNLIADQGYRRLVRWQALRARRRFLLLQQPRPRALLAQGQLFLPQHPQQIRLLR